LHAGVVRPRRQRPRRDGEERRRHLHLHRRQRRHRNRADHQPTSGNGPFGFTFTLSGKLLTSENFQGAPLQGAASSYDIGGDGVLTPVSGTVADGRSDTCWIVLTDDQRYTRT
jgi:hypothetical protein